MSRQPTAVHVVVPAHDEAELIGACLASVGAAVDRLQDSTRLTATVTVVADSCTDATLEIARCHGVDPLVVQARCVGRARDAGVRHVIAHDAMADLSHVWIAMTDADSVVCPRWLEEQFASAAGGVDLWVGAVRPDPETMAPAVLREWSARDLRSDELRVHGANLGFSAATYLRAGGFPPLSEHEDVAFVRAVIDAGGTWVAGDATVQTSGRLRGRTPGGFAAYVRTLVAELEQA
ncbi:MAG: glycosyltransferase [Nocardioides sp.]